MDAALKQKAVETARRQFKNALKGGEGPWTPWALVWGMTRWREVWFEEPEAARALMEAVSKHDRDAIRIVHTLAAEYIRRGDELPEAVAQYIAGLIEGLPLPKRRGRDPTRHHSRNDFICCVIMGVCASYGIAATRNDASYETVSACAVVAEALRSENIDLAEGAVENIWARRNAPEHIMFASLPPNKPRRTAPQRMFVANLTLNKR